VATKIIKIGDLFESVYDDSKATSPYAFHTDGQLKVEQAPTGTGELLRYDELGGGGGVAPDDLTYFTQDDESTDLPNSVQLTASDGVDLTAGNLTAVESEIDHDTLQNVHQDVNTDADVVFNSVKVADDQAVVFGDGATEGDWRIIRSGNDLVFQRLESSVWTTKGSFTA